MSTTEQVLHELIGTYAHLGANGEVVPLEVTETFWEDLATGKLGLGPGRLVSFFHFTEDWPMWEVHPAGDEFVCLVSGSMDFILEEEDGHRTIEMRTPNSFIIVPRGTWHTAKINKPSNALFVTAGEGTEIRLA